MIDPLGTNENDSKENSSIPELTQQADSVVAHVVALPFDGNLRLDALLPGVVQPRVQFIPGAAYTAPHANGARGRSNPVTARFLRGRSGP